MKLKLDSLLYAVEHHINTEVGIANLNLLCTVAAAAPPQQPALPSQPADLQPVQPADLQPADLQPADLQPADLQPADLLSADLQPADLQPVDLQPADLQHVDLQRADRRSLVAGQAAGRRARGPAVHICQTPGCDREFKKKSHLVTHERQHTGKYKHQLHSSITLLVDLQ
jgi:uncharacterized Zn-finger protein